MENLMRDGNLQENPLPHKLQPLRISSGWRISSNMFFEIDPTVSNMGWFYSGSLFCAANDSTGNVVDLEYQPEGDPNGEFCLSFLKTIGWTNISRRKKRPEYEVTGEFFSKSRIEIVDQIERFMNYA